MTASLTLLTVLSGWPQPDPANPLHLILLCLIGPLAVGLVIMLIGWTPRLLGHGRKEQTAAGLIDDSDVEARRQHGVTASSGRRALPE